MSKKYSDSEHSIDCTEDNNFSKDEYTHADQPIIEDRYTYKSYGMTLQFITGLSLPMSEHTVTRMEYRYLKDDDYTSNHSFVLNLDRLF